MLQTPNDIVAAHFQEMLELIDHLKALPAEAREHTYTYDAFGSWTLTLRFKGIPIRVIYDGREGKIAVERSESRKFPWPFRCRAATVVTPAVVRNELKSSTWHLSIRPPFGRMRVRTAFGPWSDPGLTPGLMSVRARSDPGPNPVRTPHKGQKPEA